MSFKNHMVIKALVCLAFGILFLSIPDILLSIFGATLSDGGMFTAREYGAALFGNLFLCWFAKNARESDARKAIIIALFVYDLIGFVVTVTSRYCVPFCRRCAINRHRVIPLLVLLLCLLLSLGTCLLSLRC